MEKGAGGRDDHGRSPACDPGRVARRCVAIVPAWRAERTLSRTLASLVEGNAGAFARIIVVASGDDASATIARHFAGVEVLHSHERLSAGCARNVGRAHAGDCCELLLFIDADCALAAGSVGVLIHGLEQRDLSAVGAALIGEGAGAVGWLRDLLEFKDSAPGVGAAAQTRFLPSAALLVRAAAFDRVGGFPDMWPGEDLVLCDRLVAAGGRLAKIDDAIARHLHPPGLSEFFAHQLRLGATSARARALTGMYGRGFVGRPWLAPALFAGRAARAVVWLARHRPRELPWFAALLPLYLAGLATWTFGFACARPARAACCR